VFTQRGTLGQVSLIPNKPYGRYLISQSQMKLTVDPKRADPLFLYYVFCTPQQQEYIRGRAIQTGVPHTNLGILRSTPVPAPPLSKQRAIARILGSLDDKIELNWRTNETLEETARALFRSWFVDFDPVFAKTEVADFSPGDNITGVLERDVVDRGTPVGWRWEPLLQHARLISGGTPKTDIVEYWNGNILWASAKDVSQCTDAFLVSTERKITERGLLESATRIVPKLSTVVVARGATTGRFRLLGRDMAMNQTCYALHSTKERPFWLASVFAHLVDGLVHAAHGSVFDTITTRTLETASVSVGTDQIMDAFESTVAPLYRRLLLNCEQLRTLGKIRDHLLPKLISGELSVTDADHVVAEVAA
jgi:type I restriction enzyme S subunit